MGASRGKSARNKGHEFERAIAEFLRIYGWASTTARYSNRELDDAGVDIVTEAPFNIQCKAVDQGIPYHKIIKTMPADKTPVIFHKRNRLDTMVIMKLSDFADLLLYKPKEH